MIELFRVQTGQDAQQQQQTAIAKVRLMLVLDGSSSSSCRSGPVY